MFKLFLLLLNLNIFSLGPFVSGTFYPSDKKEITNFLSTAFKNAQQYNKKTNGKDIKAIISPHAGYQFSGKIAAISYSAIKGDYDTFIIIAPSHRKYIESATTTKEIFLTPLGEVYVDKDFTDLLLKNKLFNEDSNSFVNEHSVEVQLPFLQYKFKNFKIVPILVNTTDTSKLTDISRAIKEAIDKSGKKIFIIVSSDFTHYPSYDTSKIVDSSTIESLKYMDENYFYLTHKIILNKKIKNLETTACGAEAIFVGMSLSKLLGANEFIPLENKNSYDADPKNSTKESVVGYVSGVFAKSKNTNGYKTILSEEQKKILLDEARKSIISYINGNRNIIDNTLSDIPEFNLPKAVFVTINENGYLRGCIGSTEPVLLLNDAVKYFALSAAFGDRRFKPLEKGEINKIKIEISILSPLKEINDYKKIREKVDGVMVSSSKGNGLFLPQVWDYFDKKEDFLNQLCTEKAGLDKNCWKDKETKLFIFQVEKFSE